MVSKTLLIVFFLMMIKYSIVCAKTTKCYNQVLKQDGKTVENRGVVNCTNDDEKDMCYYYAYGRTGNPVVLSALQHGCAATSIMPPPQYVPTKLYSVNADDSSEVCAVLKNGDAFYVYCKCENELCNNLGTAIHQKFLQFYNKHTGSDLDVIFNGTKTSDIQFAESTIDWITEKEPEDPTEISIAYRGSGFSIVIGKPIIIILSFGMLINSFLIV